MGAEHEGRQALESHRYRRHAATAAQSSRVRAVAIATTAVAPAPSALARQGEPQRKRPSHGYVTKGVIPDTAGRPRAGADKKTPSTNGASRGGDPSPALTISLANSVSASCRSFAIGQSPSSSR